MADRDRLRGGELNAALTDELTGIQTRYLSRAPASACTFYHGNAIVALMHDVLSKAETILTQQGRAGEVTEARSLFRQGMEADFRAAVERLTGQKVLAVLSDQHLEPDVAAMIFILDADL